MKKRMNSFFLPILALVLGAAVSQANDAPKAAVATPSADTSIEVAFQVPQSVFVIPASPREGRNPFFPRSKTEAPVIKRPDAVENYPIVLNGITSLPKRMAMINGRTFESGETGDIKLQDGTKVSVQCLEIRDDSAIIVVGTLRRELRLRNGI
jgi:hypothetical protein